MVLFAAAPANMAGVFIELGATVLGLAVLARLASRFGVSAIPLYLLGGLALGNGGLLPLQNCPMRKAGCRITGESLLSGGE